MKKSETTPDLPPGISALLDEATDQREIREARHRAASRADAKRDKQEAERRGVSTAELPPFNPHD